MDVRRLLEYCEAERRWAVETTRALVELESPTDDKGAVDRCGVELCARLKAIGGEVEVFRQPTAGDHVRATFGERGRQLLLLGHFDTVWPIGQVDRMPVRESAGVLSGPGVFDMKAGIVIGMLAVRALDAAEGRLGGRVVMLWTSDEERGSRTSRALVEREARRSDAVLVLEPSLPGGAVKTARKGIGEFVLRVGGVAAHAGIEPERGASAIDELARQVLVVEHLRQPARGTTVNIGWIEGGSRPNVVAAEAHAVLDVRVSTRAERERVESFLYGLKPLLARTTLDVSGGFSRPPLERTGGVARLYELARDVAGDLGRELAEGGSGGGSDGNLTAALGIPTLDGLGAVGDGAHAIHEHVRVDELPWRAALVAGVLDRLVRGQPMSRPAAG